MEQPSHELPYEKRLRRQEGHDNHLRISLEKAAEQLAEVVEQNRNIYGKNAVSLKDDIAAAVENWASGQGLDLEDEEVREFMESLKTSIREKIRGEIGQEKSV